MKTWHNSATFGLKRKLWLIFFAMTTLFVATVVLLNVQTQVQLVEQRAQLRAAHLTELSSAVSIPALSEGNMRELRIFFSELYEQDDVERILIVDNDARMIVSGSQADERGATVLDPLLTEALGTGEIQARTAGTEMLVAAPLRDGDQVIGALQLELCQKAMLGEVRTVWQNNVLLGIIFILLGSWLSNLLARRLTGPLTNLTEATRKAAQGDLDQSISVRSNDELEGLANSFNRMLETIRESLAEIHRVAYEDKLTGIPNRAWLNRHLERLATEASQTAFAVMFLDLDRFKHVNDTHGHHVGDLLLREFASRLRTAMLELGLKPRTVGSRDGQLINIAEREGVLARLGGDEFTMIVPADVAERLAERIMLALDKPVLLDGRRITTSTSVGIALHPEHASCRENLLKAADIAMYQAKSAGRRTYAYYDHSNFAQLQANLDMEEDLNRAIHEDEFELYLQPQFLVGSNAVIGAEALIRWQHPTRGLLSPGDFLPVAASAGLMPIIGQIMLRKTIQATARINAGRKDPLTLAVNIAIEELDQEGFADAVARMLKFYGAPASTLEIEITEGTAMEENARVIQQVAMLRGLGVQLAIDDFGMGYSNLARLKELAFETLKIDRTLVEGLGSDPASEALFVTILELAEAIEARVVAEGVETDAQRVFLRDSACHAYQVYLGGRPIPASRFQDWIAQNGVLDYAAKDEAA
ncbi:MAG: EAL domain-containing protein [Devosiaceae bacterium]|nr:EAL domain-containing protein [Devosiaceae bacterium MH13]